MNYLQKISDDHYKIKVFVKPNSKIQSIACDQDFLTIHLKAKPIQNKANKELLNLLKKALKISSNQINIVSGHKSSDKILEIYFGNDIKELDIHKALLG
ncbi:MAG: DUF167 domain-containing protein [Promethearchaeota archaeon]